MSSNTLLSGIIGVGALAAVGAGLYFLMQDDEDEIVVEYDPKVHTKEKLIHLLEEFEVEYASLYLHWYSMLKTKEKEVGKGKLDEETMEKVKEQIQELTDKVDLEVFLTNNMNSKVFNQWMEKHKNEQQVRKFKDNMERNFNKLMKIQQPQFDFKFPKEITKEKYLKYLTLAYAKFRYELYHEVQKMLRETGQQRISEEQFNEAIKRISLPNIKDEVYKAIGFPVVQNEKPTKTALKAYLILMQNDDAWHGQILGLQKTHKEILFKLPEGQKLEGMHEDPITVFEREKEYSAQFEKKDAVEVKSTPAEMLDSQNITEEAQKSYGKFSFMGSEDQQKKLVDEFLNRNKNKEEAKVEVKVEEINDDQDEEKQEKEEAKVNN